MKTIIKLISTVFCTLAVTFAVAQENQIPHVCASDEMQEQKLATHPKFARAIENLNERMLQNMHAISERSDEIYTVPVVVHVIHEGESIGVGSNITDEQVFSAITALNEDFRKMEGTNGDGDGVDCNIEFCLASRDPEGNSTNGIMRVDGSVVENYADQGIEANGGVGASEEEVKALSTWPREDYMNIWVVNEIENNNAQSGIQGYAYFPFDSPVDGIAILHNAFGTVGNLKSNTDMNRTLTHEVGHYLALYHTFHLTNSCDDEVNCNQQGDKVCDTPPTILSGTCSQPACGGTQQVENYMDYTPETCRDMYTEGQKLRMRNTLETSRSTILESMGCLPATNLDAGITNIASPSGSLCDNTQTPEITVTNFGSETLTSVTVNYRVDAGAIQTYDWTGSISQGGSTIFELPEVTTTTGSHNFIAYTTSPNGQSDENAANDQLSKEFEIATGAALNLAVNIDYFGTETSWTVTQDGEVLNSGGPYPDYQQGLITNHSICLTEGCYELNMYDSHGDGQGFQTGSFELTDEADGTQYAYGEDDWGSESINEFCIEVASSNESPVADFNISSTSICAGESIDLVDLSTNSPSSWSWEVEGVGTFSSQNPQNITFSDAGTFSVTLTVSNEFGSDQHTETVSVSEGPQISLSAQDITCNGENDGSISASITGGISPFTYSWSNNSSNSSINNLSEGDYSLTVTDAAGCESSASATIDSPEALNVNIFKSDISCHGQEDGSVTASVSGGTSPYSFSWSNGGDSNNQENLASGSISVTVVDANGCTATSSVEIVEPSALSLNTEMTAPETCSGNDGSGLVNVMGGTPNYTYAWSNGSSEQSVSSLASGNYTVTVNDANGCSQSENLNIEFDCDQTVEGTQLDETHCGMSGLTLDDEVACIPVENASMYQWKFSNLATGFYAEEYTVGSNTSFQLSNLMDMSYAQSYEVSVRVMVDEVWSPYGDACMIELDSEVPMTELLADNCNQEVFDHDGALQCQAVTGANQYTWRFVNNGSEHVTQTQQPSLPLSHDFGLEYGLVYDVSVKATVAGMDAEFGDSCPLLINNSTDIEEIDNGSLVVYPNPSDGRQMNLEFSNLFTDQSVIEFGMYDLSGKQVDTFDLKVKTEKVREVRTFETELAPGMYFLRYTMNGNSFEEKLIVQ